MKRSALIILSLALLLPCAMQAQRKTKSAKKPVKEVVEDPRITQMLAVTQKVMFIDSMVVQKANFINHIPLSPECGKLEAPDNLGRYTNELRDHRLTTMFDVNDSLNHFMVSDFIGGEWTKPVLAEGFDDSSVNFPYLMPDGTTLYFAQQGAKSIGGYDLFVTRYDADSGTFLRAENIGMPFSSEANDYLYVIDETHQLGYFVTDRRQPRDTVCIYVFVPNETRLVYQTEAYSDQQIRSLARIDSISATWSDANVRQQGLERLKEARRQFNAKQTSRQRQPSELESLRHQVEVLAKALQLSRNYYARANESERAMLRSEILQSERDLEALQLELRKKEKEFRNAQYQ